MKSSSIAESNQVGTSVIHRHLHQRFIVLVAPPMLPIRNFVMSLISTLLSRRGDHVYTLPGFTPPPSLTPMRDCRRHRERERREEKEDHKQRVSRLEREDEEMKRAEHRRRKEMNAAWKDELDR